MKLHNFLGAFVLVLSFAVGASAQEGSEVSGGGGGGVSTAGGSGTANVIPLFASATSVVDSRFVQGGTAAEPIFHFSLSGTVGASSPSIKGTTSRIAFRNGTDAAYVAVTGGDITSTYSAAGSGIGGGWADAGFTTFRAVANKGDVGTFQIASTGAYNFGSTTGNQRTESPDLGLARSDPGILKVTDGSTGQGGIGLSNAATNTVSDALILRHATSGTAAASFGTGLLFQGEDAAGNMQDMASIDAVYTDATNGSEDTRVILNTFAAGADGAALVFERDRVAGNSLSLDAADGATGVLNLQTGSTTRWFIQSNGVGGLLPFADNTYNFGHPTLKIKDAYLGTSIQGTRTQAISDNAAAATFVTIAVPTSNTTVGGRIFYTITAIDAGTAIQTKTGTYSFGLNNIGGTVTGSGTDVLEHPQISSGTLAPTFSVNISGTNAQFQLVLDTSLDAAAETLKIEYRVQIDSGTATVTPAT